MSAGIPLVVRLEAVTAVTDEVSTRIYQDLVPNDPTLPYIAVHAIAGTNSSHLGGESVAAQETYQIDVYAASYADRDAVKEAVRNALSGWRGTSNGTRISSVTLDAPLDGLEALDEGRNSGIYRSSLDARVIYERAEPTL
jgi:hypothetical protein